MRESWLGKYIGETIGVFTIVFFGCGILFSAVLFAGIGDLLSAGLAWGFAVGLAVWAAASMSGAHFNPAVTLAMAVTGRFPWGKVVQYWAAQIVGGFLGAAALVAMFWSALTVKADAAGVVIGEAGSEAFAMTLIPYSPNPSIVGMDQAAYDAVPIWAGFLTEALATAILLIFILMLIEKRSVNAPAPWFFPVGLAIGVTMLVMVTAPLTMTSLNPARDLGPRIMYWLMGFGEVAFPGIRDGWSLVVTVVAPLVGGTIGALFFDLVMKGRYPVPAEELEEAPVRAPAPAQAQAGAHV
jgi:glycerol uptake facilitator protein